MVIDREFQQNISSRIMAVVDLWFDGWSWNFLFKMKMKIVRLENTHKFSSFMSSGQRKTRNFSAHVLLSFFIILTWIHDFCQYKSTRVVLYVWCRLKITTTACARVKCCEIKSLLKNRDISPSGIVSSRRIDSSSVRPINRVGCLLTDGGKRPVVSARFGANFPHSSLHFIKY